MMELDQFESLLDDEVSQRGLVKRQVSQCICEACHIFSEAANGHNGHLILRYEDYSDNQIAELFVLQKMQQQWADPISWKEVPAKEPN